ncbi:MAG: hypothetical protein RR061_01870 [Muribaculaceae bacterium]
MNTINRFLILFFLLSITILANAEIVNIDVSSLGIYPGQPIGKKVNELLADFNKNYDKDNTLVLNFDSEGVYILDAVVNFSCNIKIKGVSNNTILEIPESFNFKGDDVAFGFSGNESSKISVEMSDISFRTAWYGTSHIPFWHMNSKYVLKIYYANKVLLNRVNIYLSNGKITNIDTRVCSNIVIQNCELVNYNNHKDGGVIWLRGDTQNVKIHNNIIRKYGNDEVIAIWGDNQINNACLNRSEIITKNNIEINNNEIIYQYVGNDKVDMPVDRLICIYCVPSKYNGRDVKHVFSNIFVRNNKFTIKDLVKNNILFKFDTYATATNIQIINNEIDYDASCISKDSYTVDLTVQSEIKGNSIDVNIKNNTINSNDHVTSENGTPNHMFLNTYGSNVIVEKNIVRSKDGIVFINSDGADANVRLIGNECNGLFMLGRFSSNGVISNASFYAINNLFVGRAFIYSRNVKNAHYEFVGNTINSSDYMIGLQNFGEHGSFIFDKNIINLVGSASDCSIYSNYEKVDNAGFDKISIQGNEFRGCTMKGIYSTPPKRVNKSVVRNNNYNDGNDNVLRLKLPYVLRKN